jgi:GAF domain-containing protein
MEEIFEAENEIEQAISQLSRLENVLEGICQEIKSSLGFDLAGISLVSLERNTIEAVHGIGIAKEWSGRAKHYLEKDVELRDIQADIVQTRRTKVISGWYKRFDRWIYDEFHHDRLIRVYMPILLIQDEKGGIIEDWFERYQWKSILTNETSEGWCRVFDDLALPDNLEIITIGTIEAGYEDRSRVIEDETVVKLAQLLSRKAIDIWKAQLPWVLRVITEKARQIMKADSASLHFLYEPANNRYIYQVFSGEVGWHFLRDCPPRRDGIGMGRQAIRERECKYIPDPAQNHSPLELEKLNKKAFDAGIKALAAFPLQIDSEYDDRNLCQEEIPCQQEMICNEGVLYVDFQQEHEFTEEELRWGGLFANRAADAIRHAIIYEQKRYREQLLTTLQSVAQSLADMPKKQELLRRIAWDTLNILAADIVTIYEYIQTEKRFITPADRAGRFKAEMAMPTQIDDDDVPAKLLRETDNVYQASLVEHPIFKNSKFAQLENIKSVAGVRLKVGEEIVGVMFINYRRFHDFTQEEIKIIETLASSAAIAIKNQRWLTARGEIDRKIITTLDRSELLNLIVEQAVKLTGADLGTICLLDPDPSQKMLILQAKYPEGAEIDPSGIPTNKGITGWVARHRLSALVDDVRGDEWKEDYIVCDPNVCSEVCVPLLDKDNNFLGVLNMESHHIRAFDKKHQQMLEAFADQAVIGIQNVQNKEKFAAREAMAAIGELAALFVHQMNGVIGGIQTSAEDIQNQVNGEVRDISTHILSMTEDIGQIVDAMYNLIQTPQSQLEPIDLSTVISQIITRMNLPSQQIEISINLLSEGHQVLANAQALSCIFENLIQNAIDSMRCGGTLSINMMIVESLVKIQVCDTGVGIEKSGLEKIFRPGYSTKLTQRRMGCGLWLAKSHIKNLKGSITVESSLSTGTTFTVILPEHKP